MHAVELPARVPGPACALYVLARPLKDLSCQFLSRGTGPSAFPGPRPTRRPGRNPVRVPQSRRRRRAVGFFRCRDSDSGFLQEAWTRGCPAVDSLDVALPGAIRAIDSTTAATPAPTWCFVAIRVQKDMVHLRFHGLNMLRVGL